MRKIIFSLAIIASMMMTSCTTLYVQTVDVKSADNANSTSAYTYKDANVTVSYNLWAPNGNPGFTITNNTNELVYVDLTKSFFISGYSAKDYYLNRTYTSSHSFSQSVSAGQTASSYGKWLGTNLLGTLASSIGTSVSKKSSNGVTYEEKPVIAIPAHASKHISEYNICSSPMQDCSVKMFPGSYGSNYKFSDGEMPEFSNVITYRVGENGKDVVFTNKFFITGFSNMKLKKAQEKTKVGCKGTVKVKTFKKESPMSFYILYNNKTSNTYSADAKSIK